MWTRWGKEPVSVPYLQTKYGVLLWYMVSYSPLRHLLNMLCSAFSAYLSRAASVQKKCLLMHSLWEQLAYAEASMSIQYPSAPTTPLPVDLSNFEELESTCKVMSTASNNQSATNLQFIDDPYNQL